MERRIIKLTIIFSYIFFDAYRIFFLFIETCETLCLLCSWPLDVHEVTWQSLLLDPMAVLNLFKAISVWNQSEFSRIIIVTSTFMISPSNKLSDKNSLSCQRLLLPLAENMLELKVNSLYFTDSCTDVI